MSLKGTSKRYGTVAIAFHWTIAALIIVAIIAGMIAEDAPRDVLTPLRVHVICGSLAGILTLIRIVWALRDVRPEQAPNTEGLQALAARSVHILLYILPLGLMASGIAMMILSGAPEILFDGADRPLPDFYDYFPRVPHGIGGKIITAAVILHVAAALWHHFWLKDGLINRMRPGGTA